MTELSDAPPEDLVKVIAGQKAIIDGLVADRDRQAQEIERLMAIRPEVIKAETIAIIERCAKAAEEAPVHYYGTKTRPMIAAAIRALKGQQP